MFEALFSESLATAVTPRALAGLHEFGRYVNDLQYKARHTTGTEDAKVMLLEWLKEIGYEQKGFDTLAVAMSYDPPAYVANYAETRRLPFGVAMDSTGEIAGL